MTAFKRNALTFFITFVISLLVFSLIAWPIMAFVRGNSTPAKPKETAAEEKEKKEPSKDVPKVIDGESFTVLLVGNDYLGDSSHSCADAIVLMRFSCETGKIVYLPIPPDTQVSASSGSKAISLSDYYNTKCRSDTDSRDVGLFAKKIEELIDFEIDYYICTSLSANALGKLVDAIDGVEFFVPYDMKGEIEEADFEIDLEKGTRTLDGEEATAMLRYLDDEDYKARAELGRDFLSALLSQCTRKILSTDALETFESFSTKTNIDEEVINKYLSTVYQFKDFDEVFLSYTKEDVASLVNYK